MTRKFSIAKYLLLLAIFLTLLFDNYLNPPGLRPFDLISWAIIFGLALFGYIETSSSFSKLTILLILIIFPGIFLGLLVQESLGAIYLIFGFLTIFCLKTSSIFKENLLTFIEIAISILSIGMFLQFITLLYSGEVPKLLPLATEDSTRSNFAGLFYRPTGFYIEPGTHSFTVLLLLGIYAELKSAKFTTVFFIGALSILLSLSLAGILALTILCMLPLSGEKVRYKSLVLKAFTLFFLIVVLFQFEQFQTAISSRLVDVFSGEDGSANDRFMGLFSWGCHNFLLDSSFIRLIVGSGIRSDLFTDYCGANNIAWLLYSFGYLPTFFIVFMLIKIFNKSLLLTFILIYILFSSPISSYAFIYLYIVMVMIYSRRGINES